MTCGERSRQAIEDDPQSFFLCTQDYWHCGQHTSRDGRGAILAMWWHPRSRVKAWVPGLGPVAF